MRGLPRVVRQLTSRARPSETGSTRCAPQAAERLGPPGDDRRAQNDATGVQHHRRLPTGERRSDPIAVTSFGGVQVVASCPRVSPLGQAASIALSSLNLAG
jgi:hypothetical protein